MIFLFRVIFRVESYEYYNYRTINLKMKHIKNIIFDFGGVLIDWNPKYLYSKVFGSKEEMNYFLENICRPEWNLMQDAGRPLAEAILSLQQEFPKYKDEIAIYYGRWKEMLGGTIDENVSLIKPLKEKYKLYGLTNWSDETIPIAMELYGFFSDLDGIVVSGAEKVIKPDAKLYQILLDRYQIIAEESLFIDDNADNIVTAKEMGFNTIHFTNDFSLEKKLMEYSVL